MSAWHGKDSVSVRQHARMCGEMYIRFCQVAAETPWMVSPIERDAIWEEYAHQWTHPAGTCAAYEMAQVEAYFGLRSGVGTLYGAK